jgi:heme/copper-type cytochrome/quinol oxidase subunit 2
MTNTKYQTPALRAGASVPNFKYQIAMAAAVLAIVILVVPVPLTLAAPQVRHLRVEASQFQFTPSVVSVNPGDKVTIDLTSNDVVHGLYVDDYALNITADPGQTTRLTFVADKVGTFALRCSAPCGPVHPFMVGKLNVGPNWLLWRAIGVAGVVASAGFWMLRK